jgi:putative PIN family toxin of toxin-antitoxin system
MNVVLDTSVYISILLSGRGAGAWITALWNDKKFQVVISPAIFEELLNVIERPHIAVRLDPQRKLALLRRLRHDVVWVDGSTEAVGLDDPEDNILLSAALDGQCNFIVTWDQILLKQKMCQGIRLVNPDQFVSLIVRMK